MTFSGIVIHGKKRGRMLGYPTANIEFESLIDSGVFSGYARLEEEWLRSAIFIHPNKPLLEVHILDFDGDLYGKVIEVEIVEKIRDSIQFESLEELKKQIARDIQYVIQSIETES